MVQAHTKEAKLMATVRIYCECCGENVPLEIEPMSTDELNGDKIWGDIVCPECHFVIATLTADESGIYAIEKVGDAIGAPRKITMKSAMGLRFTAGFIADVEISRWLRFRLKVAALMIQAAIWMTGASLSWEG